MTDTKHKPDCTKATYIQFSERFLDAYQSYPWWDMPHWMEHATDPKNHTPVDMSGDWEGEQYA